MVIKMDKMNYIAELEECLKTKIKASTLIKMVEYYAQYFNDHMDAGQKEEEICEEEPVFMEPVFMERPAEEETEEE